ncbi:hypothetical protein ENBRE01_0875 [Enteropsectra breve]|nr:hypothetical protein ENBRE01_0875 [Enteropsectra breve]
MLKETSKNLPENDSFDSDDRRSDVADTGGIEGGLSRESGGDARTEEGTTERRHLQRVDNEAKLNDIKSEYGTREPEYEPVRQNENFIFREQCPERKNSVSEAESASNDFGSNVMLNSSGAFNSSDARNAEPAAARFGTGAVSFEAPPKMQNFHLARRDGYGYGEQPGDGALQHPVNSPMDSYNLASLNRGLGYGIEKMPNSMLYDTLYSGDPGDGIVRMDGRELHDGRIPMDGRELRTCLGMSNIPDRNKVLQDKREKNRMAAKRSREKKAAYMINLEKNERLLTGDLMFMNGVLSEYDITIAILIKYIQQSIESPGSINRNVMIKLLENLEYFIGLKFNLNERRIHREEKEDPSYGQFISLINDVICTIKKRLNV